MLKVAGDLRRASGAFENPAEFIKINVGSSILKPKLKEIVPRRPYRVFVSMPTGSFLLLRQKSRKQ